MSDANTNGTGGMWPGKATGETPAPSGSCAPLSRQEAVDMRRAAIQIVYSCDRILGWETRIERQEVDAA